MRSLVVTVLAVIFGFLFLWMGLLDLGAENVSGATVFGQFFWAGVFFYGAYWTYRRGQKKKSKQYMAEHHKNKRSE